MTTASRQGVLDAGSAAAGQRRIRGGGAASRASERERERRSRNLRFTSASPMPRRDIPCRLHAPLPCRLCTARRACSASPPSSSPLPRPAPTCPLCPPPRLGGGPVRNFFKLLRLFTRRLFMSIDFLFKHTRFPPIFLSLLCRIRAAAFDQPAARQALQQPSGGDAQAPPPPMTMIVAAAAAAGDSRRRRRRRRPSP